MGTMTIEQELLAAAEITRKRGEEDQPFYKRLAVAVGEVADDVWSGLSAEAQAWFNSAADAIEAKKDVALPPGAGKAADADPPPRRRGAAAPEPEKQPEPAAYTPALKDQVRLVTKRGKEVLGTVVEVDDEVIVLDVNGKDEEFGRDRVETVELVTAPGATKDDDSANEPELKTGAQVRLVTKRGKEVEGKLVEFDDDVLIVDTGGKEEEFGRDRVEKIEVLGGSRSASPTPTPAASAPARRGSAKPAEPEKPAAGDRSRSSNPGKPSVSQRIQELLAEDPEVTEEAAGKQLKKEGIEFKDNTLQLTFRSYANFLKVLKAAGRLKK